MDFGYNGGNGSGDNHEEISNSDKHKKSYHRHTPQQIQQLELFFKDCPHPDENQRRQLSHDLGLEPKQIKFWFQNKRTQNKAQNERTDKNTLRQESERIHSENLAIGEALKNVICPACRDPPLGAEELQHNIQQLRIENALLKQEYERATLMHANMSGKPVTHIQSLSTPGVLSHGIEHPLFDLKSTTFPYQFKGIQETEKSLVVETAASALNELIELVQVNEPVWMKPRNDGPFVLQREIYNNLFPKFNHFTSSSSRIEASKDSCVVKIPPQQLVEMFLDPSKWTDLFPIVIPKARILEVLDTGNLSGSLILMYEQMHIMSPLVEPREFFFLRYSQPLESAGTWVVVDVSYDCFKEVQNTSPTRSWKFPSGCMIQSLPSGKTQVTWVEHVEVEDISQIHHLYRDLVSCGDAYGAKRWTTTLERMCERFICTMGSTAVPSHELEGVIILPEGHRNVLKLCQRMVKDFCEMLSMSAKMDFQNLSKSNNSGVQVNVRKSIDTSQLNATIVSAATSLWVPLSRNSLFNFFKDEKTRPQWDVVSSGHLVNEIAHISCGTHPGNCVSIIQPVPHEKNELILQENYIDPLGALVVYTPIGLQAITEAINGEDTGRTIVLPSGFIISGDGRSPDKLRSNAGASTSTCSSSSRHGGSILTVVFQVLVNAQSRQMNMEAVATANTLISSTVQKVKAAFNIENLE